MTDIVSADDYLLLWQQVRDPEGNSRAVSHKLSLRDGEPLEPERGFEVTAFRGILPDETGQRQRQQSGSTPACLARKKIVYSCLRIQRGRIAGV